MTTNARNQSQGSADTKSSSYYVSDYSKLSLIELWRMRSLSPFRMLYLAKLLRAKITRQPVRIGVPSLYDNFKRLELNEIPSGILRGIEPPIRSLQSAGFTVRLVQNLTRSKGNFGYAVHLLCADRLSVAGVVFAHVTVGRLAKTETVVAITTYRQNGLVLQTSNTRPRLIGSPELQVIHLVGAAPEQLLARHRKRLLNCTDAAVVREDDFADRVMAAARRLKGFHIDRGVFAPANSEEMARYREQTVAPGVFEME